MNLNLPDVSTLEVHPAPWSTPRNACQPPSILQEREDLGLPLLLHAVADAANLGYNFLHVACSEPLSYPGLLALCREAHHHRMLTAVNAGSAELTAQLEWLRYSIDLLGVELDGHPAGRHRRTHSPRVLQSVEQRLALVRDSGIPFAIAFPLTPASLAELAWAAEFAAAQGAAMLQVRPSPRLTGEQMAAAWEIVEGLRQRRRGKPAIHLDAVSLHSLSADPGDLASWRRDLERNARCLGEIVSPLVIEEGGTVTPLRYGFPRRLAFGNLHRQRLGSMTAQWIASQASAFCQVYGKVLHNAHRDGDRFGDLHQMMSLEAGGDAGIAAAC